MCRAFARPAPWTRSTGILRTLNFAFQPADLASIKHHVRTNERSVIDLKHLTGWWMETVWIIIMKIVALIRRSSLGLVLWIARIVDCPEHLRSVPCSRGKDCSFGAAHLDHRSGPNTKKIAGIEPGTIENLARLPSSQPMAEIPNGRVSWYLRLHIDHVRQSYDSNKFSAMPWTERLGKISRPTNDGIVLVLP